MAADGEVNGHRPRNLQHLLNPSAGLSSEKLLSLRFDVDAALGAVVGLEARVPEEAFTARFLGTERQGHAVLIDDAGLVLTIGYLIAEASDVMLTLADGSRLPAEWTAYDYETGFGLTRAVTPIAARPLTFGRSADMQVDDPVVVAGAGGRQHAVSGRVAAVREFAGYWEYLVDDAIFTEPPHPDWGGTALLDAGGLLCGIGSLYVEQTVAGAGATPGNMFVPIDLLKSILPEMLAEGRVKRPPRPWLGLFTTEVMGHLVVAGVAPDSPADFSGLEQGDVIVSLNGAEIRGMRDLYMRLWSVGKAGIVVHLTVLRDDATIDVPITTADRNSFLTS